MEPGQERIVASTLWGLLKQVRHGYSRLMNTGTTSWQLMDGAGGHDGDQVVDSHTEQIIGAFEPDAGTFYLVETEENGIIHGRFISDNEISVFLIQSGKKPVVSHIKLRKM